MAGNVGSQTTKGQEGQKDIHEGARRTTKGHEEKLKENEFLRHQAAAAVSLKIQRFAVTICAHRFRSKNLVNLFFKNMLTDSENRCVLPVVRNPG